MSDSLKKFIPYSYRDSDAIEAWLEELAREGLVLQGDWLWGLAFRRTKPIKLRFRMDNSKGAKLEQRARRREQLAELGWQYVTFKGGLSIYQNEDLEQWELPAWEGRQKQSRFRGYRDIGFLLLVYILLVLVIGGRLIFGGSLLEFIQKDSYQLPFLLIFTLAVLAAFTVEVLRSRCIKKRKEDQSFARRSYHTKERARRGSRRALAGIVLCFVAPMTVNFFSNPYDYWEMVPIQNYQNVLPVPQLSELVKEENSKRNANQLPELTEGKYLAQNEVAENNYFLMPREVRLYQEEGNYYSPQGAGRQGGYYDPVYYELKTEGLAKKVLEDLKKEYSYTELPASQRVQAYHFQNVQNNSFPEQALLIRYDKKLVRVYYQGEMDLRQYASLFARYLGATESLMPNG